jgi:hypothetical protein
MQIAVETPDQNRSGSTGDTDALKRKVESLRRQFQQNPDHCRPLSWDTNLLVRKTQNLSERNIVSCSDANWHETLQRMHIGREGVRVNDVRTVEHIEFVAAFAAKRDLVMTYGNHSFHLEPRHASLD